MNLSNGFSERTVAAGKISFSLLRTNLLKETIHWAIDFRRFNRTPSPIAIINAVEFCAAIEAARHRARIRKYILEKLASLSKAAYPSKLKRHKYWVTWSRALKNYLSTIIGQDGVPFSYVIRESAAPYYTIELQPDYNFERLLINCVPLTGITYKIDVSKMHQLIHGFVQGEIAEI